LLGPLDIFYESAACEDQAAKGRLRYIRDVRYVYLSHFLVDALLPLKILNKTQQRDSVLVCELGSGVLAVTKVIDGLRTTIGESEKLFWSCFNESKMVYEKDSHAVNLKWQGGPLLRGAGYNIATTLEKDRTEVIDAFVNDLKTFTVDDWQVFDIMALPEGAMNKYGIQSIKNLYLKYSEDVSVLAVMEDKENKGAHTVETVQKKLLPSNSKKTILLVITS
jgi:hypothetical protein